MGQDVDGLYSVVLKEINSGEKCCNFYTACDGQSFIAWIVWIVFGNSILNECILTDCFGNKAGAESVSELEMFQYHLPV